MIKKRTLKELVDLAEIKKTKPKGRTTIQILNRHKFNMFEMVQLNNFYGREIELPDTNRKGITDTNKVMREWCKKPHSAFHINIGTYGDLETIFG